MNFCHLPMDPLLCVLCSRPNIVIQIYQGTTFWLLPVLYNCDCEFPVTGTGKDIGNPSWKRSLPHVFVASLTSLLFGYHLGCVRIYTSNCLLFVHVTLYIDSVSFNCMYIGKKLLVQTHAFFCGRRVVNETLESISIDLGFSGNTIAEGIYGFFMFLFLHSLCLFFCLIILFLMLVDEGLVVSTCLGGAFIGSLFSGLVADGVGRRRAFQLSALPMIIGASVRLSFFFFSSA